MPFNCIFYCGYFDTFYSGLARSHLFFVPVYIGRNSLILFEVWKRKTAKKSWIWIMSSIENWRALSFRMDEQVLVHTRSIGDKNYTVKKTRFWLWSKIFFRSIGTQQIEQYWTCYLPRGMEKKPKIRIPQQQSGGFIRFFKKLFKYE